MTQRALLLGMLLGFLAAMIPSCGSTACSSSNCKGCCTSEGRCIAPPDSLVTSSCGFSGSQCQDCATESKACNPSSGTCEVAGTFGGDGGEGCDGCVLPNGLCLTLALTSPTNCGNGGAACASCQSGETCQLGACLQVNKVKAVGSACANDQECRASLGNSALCKTMTSSGNGAYAEGYCTLPCQEASGAAACPTGAMCVLLTPRYGEGDEICWDRCSRTGGDPCRTGYRCYKVGADTQGNEEAACWIDPLPPQDAGPPADKVGQACDAGVQCQNPPSEGVCIERDLTAEYPGGYCSRTDCSDHSECSPDGGAVCLATSLLGNLCYARCSSGGVAGDAGQAECRDGYVCMSFIAADGGRTADGYCRPPYADPPTKTGDACLNKADCRTSSHSLADCIRENETQSDGGLGPTGYLGGYCTRFDCILDSDCGTGANDAGAFCLQADISSLGRCYVGCPSGGGGQSTCRVGYICTSYVQPDGGNSGDGYCDFRCENRPGSCGNGLACLPSGYCG